MSDVISSSSSKATSKYYITKPQIFLTDQAVAVTCRATPEMTTSLRASHLSHDSTPLGLTNSIVVDLENKADFLACRQPLGLQKVENHSNFSNVIKLVPEEGSIQIIRNLVARPDLSVHVKEISYHDTHVLLLTPIQVRKPASPNSQTNSPKFMNMKHPVTDFFKLLYPRLSLLQNSYNT